MGVIKAGHVAHNTISVATSATVVVSERLRSSLVVQNLDAANPIYVGGSGVTSSNGVKVTAGQSISFDDFSGKLYAIATGGSVDTRYLEVY